MSRAIRCSCRRGNTMYQVVLLMALGNSPANGSGYYDEGGRYYRLPAPREERREMKEQRDDRRKDRRSSEEESSPNEASPEAIPAPSDSADPVGVSRVVPRERMGLLARFRAGRR